MQHLAVMTCFKALFMHSPEKSWESHKKLGITDTPFEIRKA
jgi:hypothetical protein